MTRCIAGKVRGEENVEVTKKHAWQSDQRRTNQAIATLSKQLPTSHNIAMAQGTVKQKVKTEPKKSVFPSTLAQEFATDFFVRRGARPTGPQMGNRVIKPKKAALLKQANMKKVRKSWSGMRKAEQTADPRVEALRRLDHLDRALSRRESWSP
jgi:hypothetical protein